MKPFFDVRNVTEQDDGAIIIEFDLTDDFIKSYLETFDLDDWDEEHFNNWVIEALKNNRQEEEG